LNSLMMRPFGIFGVEPSGSASKKTISYVLFELITGTVTNTLSQGPCIRQVLLIYLTLLKLLGNRLHLSLSKFIGQIPFIVKWRYNRE
jgi:hypothetical protein